MILLKKIAKVSAVSILWLVGYDVGIAADKAQPTTRLSSTISASSSKLFTSQGVPTKLHLIYPYNAIGKLWFTKSDGTPGVCTASLIKPGVVLTAGHCVHSGNGSATGYSYNFRFAPGYHNGVMPFGLWSDALYRNVPTEWYKSGGKRPNVADFALIVFPKDNVGKRIGDVTEWLGWKWNNNANVFTGRHITAIGYTNNFGKGAMQHKVGSVMRKNGRGIGIFASDLLKGADGSPVILREGTSDYDNYVFSVISYSATGGKKTPVNIGSLFNKRFGDLLDQTCKLYFWACQTS